MNILIIGTSGLPIPDVLGGAVQILISQYLKKADSEINFVVYSTFSKKISDDILNEYPNNVTFRFINQNRYLFRIKKVFFGIIKRIFLTKAVGNAYSREVYKDIMKRNEIDKYSKIIVENEVNTVKYYKKRLNGIVINHVHTNLINTNVKNAYDIVNYCDEFWCVSKYIANEIKKVNDKSNTIVIYNGIDYSMFKKEYLYDLKSKFYEKYSINKDDFIVLYCGRIMKDKGVIELINAFNKISNVNFKLLIIGSKKDNSYESNNYYNQVIDLINKNKNIIYLGRIPYKELPFYYNISNLQVVPSICEEAFGLVLIEGIASRHPMIITNSGGMVEIVDKDSAIIVEKENLIDNLYNAIINIYNDKEKQKMLVDNAYKLLDKYSENEFINNFNKLLKK